MPVNNSVASIQTLADILTTTGWGGPGGDTDTPFYWSTSATTVSAPAYNAWTANITGIDSDGQYLATKALDLWASAGGFTYSTVSSGEMINFYSGISGAHTAYTLKYSGPPVDVVLKAEVQIGAVNPPDTYTDTYGAGLGNWSFWNYLHEIGHNLCLNHQGDYNSGTPSYSTYASYYNDTLAYSIMSYMKASEYNSFSDVMPVTPMMADLVAIQDKLGYTRSAHTGNSTYGFNAYGVETAFNLANYSSVDYGTDDLSGFRSGFVENRVAMCIWDDGGTDTLDLSGYSEAQTINMASGTFSSMGGCVGNLSIDINTTIEIAKGGSGADTIYTAHDGDTVYGNGGADTISVISGNDNCWVYGDAGADNISVASGHDNILHGNADGDAISVTGTDNYLYGDAGNDTLTVDITSGYGFLGGGAGADNIIFTSGDSNTHVDWSYADTMGGDAVYNFNLSNGVCHLEGWGLNWSSLQTYLHDSGGNCYIDFGGSYVGTFIGFNKASLSSGNFEFS